MTWEIGFLIGILGVMVALFLTEKLPVDLTAFLGLVVLVFAGYVDANQAFAGFASPAVITMLSIFIVSASLLNTGVADMVGARIHRWVGSREVPLIVAVMLVAGVLSAFMNNIAAAAVLMPAVASLGRQAGLSPSRLFMPLAFGSILGGTTTLVGTPPNILASAMLTERGLEGFELFDFAPMGLALLATGTLFMATLGRRLLPSGEATGAPNQAINLARVYELEDRLFSIKIPKGSRLDGATLGESRLGSALRVQIVAITRSGNRLLAPTSDTRLRGEDELLVQGRLEDLRELLNVRGVEVAEAESRDLELPEHGVGALRLRVSDAAALAGKTLREIGFRERYGVVVAGVVRQGQLLRENLGSERLEGDDVLFCVGSEERVEGFAGGHDLVIEERGLAALEGLSQHDLFAILLPAGSPLVGRTLGVSRMGELMGLTVVGIFREGMHLAPSPDEVLAAGDRLLVSGERSRVVGLLALGDVELEAAGAVTLESEQVQVVEATVAPRSSVIGRSLSQLAFRHRHGMQVLAIWREGRPIRRGLAELALRVGDALLLQGERANLARFAADADFVVLSEVADRPVRTAKAPYAIGGLALMVLLVVAGWQPIQVAAFTAASLIVLSGALTMQEAYRAIEWRAIFLVAAVLPVGAAMESSGAAALLAQSVMSLAGPWGPYAVLASLILLSSILSQGLDGAPAVVLMTPVVLEAASGLGLSPYPLMMGVGLAASAAFMTPFSHKANLLVMGLGGYRSMDYVRVGTPLTVVVLVLLVVMVPIFFPF